MHTNHHQAPDEGAGTPRPFSKEGIVILAMLAWHSVVKGSLRKFALPLWIGLSILLWTVSSALFPAGYVLVYGTVSVVLSAIFTFVIAMIFYGMYITNAIDSAPEEE